MSADPLSVELVARLRGFIARRVRTDADADDVLHDVLLKLVERGAKVPSSSVHAWLFTVARRAIIDHARRRRTERLREDVAIDPARDEPDAARDLSRCMEPMLKALPERDRELLRRVDMGGESQASVARELGLSASGLKSRVQRARARLRAVLERCCALELDRRGSPADFRRRPGRPCPCAEDDAGACPPR